MENMKILLDTDMGSDCDDAGALALLHIMCKDKNAEILAITHCASEIGGTITIQAINEYFGKENIPVGRYVTKAFLEDSHCKKYTATIMKDYLETHEMPVFESAVRVMRKCLVKHRDVTMISIGVLNNIAELLESGGDDISDLTGLELISRSVKELYVMGGNFKDLSIPEYNIRCDIKASQLVSNQFPAPIIYCGFELGERVFTGKCFQHRKDNPMKKIYSLYNESGVRESWDPITVFCALEPESDLFVKSEKKKITFSDDGKSICEDGGKDCYMIMNKTPEQVQEVLERICTAAGKGFDSEPSETKFK